LPDAVTNTSPLQYLHQLGRLEILPALLSQVFVPPAVVQEIERGRRLGISLPDLSKLPWLHPAPVESPPEKVARLEFLGPGERAVFSFALARPNTLVVLDDAEARRRAHEMGLDMVGTLGLLRRARREKLIPSLAQELDALQQLGFRFAPALRQSLLREVNEG
jgi:predicted nucleic acid-binding protein